jgi:hypothetical protein
MPAAERWHRRLEYAAACEELADQLLARRLEQP